MISNFIPEIWTSGVVDILQKNLVFEKVCNRSFEKDVMDYGDTVHILTAGTVADAAYPATSNITYSALSDGTQDLSINIKRYAAFEDTDIERKQSKPAYTDMYTKQMAYQISDYFDTQIAAEYANASLDSYETGTTAWQFSLDCSDFPRLPAAILRQLEVANAPAGTPFLIGPPQMREAVLRYLGPRASTLGDAVMQNGYVGNVMGMNLYTSNNVSTHGLAGIEGQSIALAYQIKKMESLRLEGRFSDGVRALYVGGIKTYQPAISVDVNLNATLIATS